MLIRDSIAAHQLRAIRQTVHTAENMAADALHGYPLREVVVNVPGVHLRTSRVDMGIAVAGHEVTDNDVRRACPPTGDR